MIYFFKTPVWLKKCYPSVTWQKKAPEKVIYLTFDDGPIPGITPYVLHQLERFNAKATFFCVGENIVKYSGVFEEVVAAGHAIGNHTYHHINGWNVSNDTYLADISRCGHAMRERNVETRFFRPPHGRIRKSQVKALSEKYEIIMWSHLSGDFDPSLNKTKALSALKKAEAGTIMVFHDSTKAEKNLKKLLPEILTFYHDQGYTFKTLSEE